MSKNFEERPLNPPIDGDSPPLPPELSPPEEMSQPREKFSFGSFVECTNLPGYKKVTAGIGVKLPFPSDSTHVIAGIETNASVFATRNNGVQIARGAIVPSVRLTQDLGKNAKLMARVSPSPNEYARIGVQFNF